MSNAEEIKEQMKDRIEFDVKIIFYDMGEKEEVIKALENDKYPLTDAWLKDLLSIFRRN